MLTKNALYAASLRLVAGRVSASSTGKERSLWMQNNPKKQDCKYLQI